MLKTIAWNGVSFRVPSAWTLAAVDRRYLLLEDGSGVGSRPALELKWDMAGHRFSPDRVLDRLGRGSRPMAVLYRSSPDPAPEDPAPPAGMELRSFVWAGGGHSGRGLLLYCPGCRTVIVGRFAEPISPEGSPAAFVESYREHGGKHGGPVPFQVYDFRLEAPSGWRLEEFSFKPGLFELSFHRRRSTLRFLRFAPADVLLRGTSLASLAGRLAPGSASKPAVWRGCESVESVTSRLGGLLGRHLRLWHVPEKNRILGVEAGGWGNVDDSLLNAACGAYEAL